jgi:hypothetical protein
MQLLLSLILWATFAGTPDSESGIVYFSYNDGSSWTNISKGIPKDASLTDIASDNVRLGISTKQHGIFLFDQVQNNWQPVPKNPPTTANLDALIFHNKYIFTGTQNAGIFLSVDLGRNWVPYNAGLQNLTIRRLAEFEHTVYACTNAGLYRLNEKENKWQLACPNTGLQVNGITQNSGDLYIGTNHGVYKQAHGQNDWRQVLANQSLHNISSDGTFIYAMVYNELFTSANQGLTWQSDQKGMPTGKYTFQVLQTNASLLAGQWDGIYKKEPLTNWVLSNKGLPVNFPVTELKVFKKMIIAASSGWVQ